MMTLEKDVHFTLTNDGSGNDQRRGQQWKKVEKKEGDAKPTGLFGVKKDEKKKDDE